MKKTKLMIALLAGLTLGACSNDNDELTPQPKQEPSFPLTIEVTENPMMQDGEEGNDATRSDITTGTSASFTSFNIDYVYGANSTGHKVSMRTGDNWEAGSWPTTAVETNAEVKWYAYTGGTFNLNEGTPYINFEVDENVAAQHDLLVATTSGTYSGTLGNLSFAFDHPCAAVRFWIKKSTNINDKTFTVSNIKLKNVIKDGKYYYGTKTWNKGTTSTEFTLYSGSGYTLPALPSNTYLEVTCSITNTNTSTVVHNDSYAYIPFQAAFAAGKKYDVKINIGKNSLYSGPNTLIIP